MQRIIKTILLISIGLLFSCTLFRPKCPIPNCKIRQEHRHALTFSEDVKKGKWSLEKQGEKWAQENDTTLQNNLDEESASGLEESDSTSTPHEEKLSRKEKRRRRKLEKELAKAEKEEQERKEAEEIAAQNALLDNPQEIEEDPEKPEKKKKKKRKKDKGLSDEEKLAMEEELYADDSQYHSSDTDALSDEELAEREKVSDQEAKAAEKAGKEEGEDILTYWRSRITEWFRKNQKPKIGEYWKKPKQN